MSEGDFDNMTYSGHVPTMPIVVLALVGVAGFFGARWYSDKKRHEAEDAQLQALVQQAVLRIASAFGVVPEPPLVFTDQVHNAAANGAAIWVNARWFKGQLEEHCSDPACNHAVAHFVLAHEMTHHVRDDHYVPEWIRNHQMELRADFNGGRAMALFGDDIDTIERVLLKLAPVPSETHPAFPERIRAARAGYAYEMRMQAAA
jgi:hypothetical protein